MESWDQTIAWTLSILIFFGFRRFWTKKRGYFIAAGILLFTPSVIYYPGITGYFSAWPLIGSLPGYLFIWYEADLWLFYVLPPATVTGLIFWAIAVWRKI